MKKIAIITTTRAEYSLLLPVICELRKNEGSAFKAELIVSGTHLSEKFGKTAEQIKQDHIRIDKQIPIPVDTFSAIDLSVNMAVALIKFTELFEREKYDAIMILGDRYEILAAALAAVNTRTAIFHLCGGDTTEGALDECYRHSITKMSYLHFVSNECSRHRVIQLGEDPARVYNVGSTSIDNIKNRKLLSKQEILTELQIHAGEYALCTYHPETLNHSHIEDEIAALLAVVKAFADIHFIFTKANADQGGQIVNRCLAEAKEKLPNLSVFSSLGTLRYLSLMKSCLFVLGNSSSGIIEAPSFNIPTINIGDRQRGRLQSTTIINCVCNADRIVDSVHIARSKAFRESCLTAVSPYGDGNAAARIADITMKKLNETIDLKKAFYDLKQQLGKERR